MRLEVIQYALKCKEELDVILGAIDKIKLMLFDNQLDEIYEMRNIIFRKFYSFY